MVAPGVFLKPPTRKFRDPDPLKVESALGKCARPNWAALFGPIGPNSVVKTKSGFTGFPRNQECSGALSLPAAKFAMGSGKVRRLRARQPAAKRDGSLSNATRRPYRVKQKRT